MSSSNKTFHARSISLPTRSNPLAAAVEEQLCKLRYSLLTSSISNNLVALKDLYECVEDFLSAEDGKCLDAVLDRSVMLLDVCGTIKDVSSQMKQSAQDLQSSIRRQSNEFDAYMTSRKKACKVIQKCLSDIKKNTNKNNDLATNILTEVEATTLAVFESMLSFLSAPKQRSLVSKLTTKSATQQVVNEVTKVDVAMKSKVIEAKEVQKSLAALEMNLEKLEDGLESVFSLPTRSNPLAAAVEEQLCKLRSSVLTASISNNLVALKDLYKCVEDFLSTKDGICLDAALDRSVMLLDVCGTIRDVSSQMKQSAQDLQSSIRRQSNEFDAYTTSRKKVFKVIQKCLSDLKKNTNKNNDLVTDVLTEVEATTLAVFEYILSFLSAPKQRSLVPKLTNKSATQQVVNEVTKIDKSLAALEMNLQELEDGLESVFSFPTRSNPLAAAVEEQLCILRSSVLTSSISNNLVALKNLYECVEDFLSTEDGKCLDTVLDRSVMLLDVCGAVKDVSSQMKQSAQDLQSSIRRQSNEFDAYMTSRKKACKVIQKCLSDIKKNTNKNNDLVTDVLTEVEATTLAVFESILSFLSAPKQRSLVSKLTTKSATQQVVNEVTKVDVALKSKVIEAKEVQKSLAFLEMNLQELEDGLESVFRGLIKNRVSLLNILNQ
ncbi:hypothetical protein MKX03_026064 [Papaver bracteatum]|nr:hypothetical protein MKX03_026064 [Papaver bracteatum]